jgi:transcriptional regulator with XRE-family HTH domain
MFRRQEAPGTIRRVDDVRVGRLLRALRRRKGWHQREVGAAAGLSQQAISLIERGHLASLSIRAIRRAFSAVDARFDGSVSWRGGQIDRLLNERHASLVGQIAEALVGGGWDVHVEMTFSEYGERGSIDVLALQTERGIALVIEVKTELTAIDDTIRRLDVKHRLGSKLVFDRFGWRPRVVGRMLVVLDRSTNRRRVAAHDGSLLRAFPDRGRSLRQWLQAPIGSVSGLRFVLPTNRGGTGRTVTGKSRQ